MNPKETTAVLAVLSATWPSAIVSAETTRVWVQQLARVLPEDALEAARQLGRTDERFPALNRFIETCQAAARARALRDHQQAIEPEAYRTVSTEDAKANVAEIRKLLRTGGITKRMPS